MNFQDLYEASRQLTKFSTHQELHTTLEIIAKYQPVPFEHDKLLRSVAKQAGSSLKVIKQEYAMVLKKLNMEPEDVGFQLAQAVLKSFYAESGLKRYPDGNFYVYEKTHWRMTTQDRVRANIQELAVDFLSKTDKNLKALVSDAYGCLCDYLGTDEDALDFTKTLIP